MQLERILVAMKPWQRALPLTVEHARLLTGDARAELRLVTSVFDAAIAARRERGDAAAAASLERAVTAARVELDRLASPLRRGGARVTTHSVWGIPPYEAIGAAACEWGADLLVLGTHEPAGHARLTETDWQLVRRAACPLLLIKNAAFSGYRTIVAVAGAETERRAVVRASGRDFGRASGAELVVEERVPGAALARARCHASALVVVGAPSADAADPATEALLGEAPCDVLVVPHAAAA